MFKFFFHPNFFFISKKNFPLSLVYAFLDVSCHPECSNLYPIFTQNFSDELWVKQGATQCYQAFLIYLAVSVADDGQHEHVALLVRFLRHDEPVLQTQHLL